MLLCRGLRSQEGSPVTSARPTALGLLAGCVAATTLCVTAIPIPPPSLTAATLVLKGTDIGDVPTDAQYLGFVAGVVNGVGAAVPPVAPTPSDIVGYPASFKPFSKGGLNDPTWNGSVQTGTENLTAGVAATGDDAVLIFGYSQGAVVASKYKGANPAPAREGTLNLRVGSCPWER